MKKWITLLLLFCLTGWASAQTEPARDKDLGILFSFHGLSDLGLGSYGDASGNYGLGAKFFKGNKAVRTMLLFNTSSTSLKLSGVDTTNVDDIESKDSSSRYGMVVDGLIHANSSRISPFFGAGVGFIKEQRKMEPRHLKTTKAYIDEEKTINLLIRGILGVEFFIKKNMSLSGEYSLQYRRVWKTILSGSSNNTETKGTGSSLGLSAAGSLTLSIYFAKSSK